MGADAGGGMSGSGAPGGSQPAGERKGTSPEAMHTRLLQMTTLKLKDDKAFQPADVKVQQTPKGPVMVFSFSPNELKLGPEDRQLTFKTSLGPMVVQVKFNLKDMVFDNQLALQHELLASSTSFPSPAKLPPAPANASPGKPPLLFSVPRCSVWESNSPPR